MRDRVIKAVVAGVVFGLALGCHGSNDDRPSGVVPAVCIAPTITCDDFDGCGEARTYPNPVLPATVCADRVCAPTGTCGECWYNCPDVLCP